MKHERHIVITGFGGQGIIMAGDVLGKAATLYDNNFASMTQAYGPEARGGACSAQIIISDEEVLFPYIKEPHVLICLSQEGYSKNIGSLRDGGMLILEADLVQVKKISSNVTAYNIPATRFAEELGNKMMANIVMLGFLTSVTEVVGYEAMKQALFDSIPSGTEELNLNAFEKGYEYGKQMKKQESGARSQNSE